MAAIAVTTAAPGSPVRGFASANVKVRYFDITLDTGDYAQTGQVFTAASLGYKSVYFVTLPPVIMKADKTVAAPVGVTYGTGGVSFTLFLYESAGDGDGMDNKPAEANNYTNAFRIRVEGI